MENLFSLKGKIALVTGATGHLGRAMATGLAQMGALIYINGRNADKVEKFVRELSEQGFQAKSAVFNIDSKNEIQAFFEQFPDKQLDILVNNAYAGAGGTIETATPEQYEESYSVSVIASHNLLQSALTKLRQAVKTNGDASVINISSMYGMVSPDLRIYTTPEGSNPPFYGAAKAALIQFTKYAACEFAHERVRVNVISPGPFPSTVVQNTAPDLVEKIINKVPMRRIGQPDDLKSAICFLASSASSYITGINLPVDGGWTSW